MKDIRGIVDPLNTENYYIFGGTHSNECYYFNKKEKIYVNLGSVPKHYKQLQLMGHGCAYFKIKNQNNYNNNYNNYDNYNHYALIYGSNSNDGYFQIFDLKLRKWDSQISKYNNLWFNDENIMKNRLSKYGFGHGLSMVTDLFNPNIVHIAGGHRTLIKYGYFDFDNEFNAPNQCLFVWFCFFFYFFLCAQNRK